MSNVEQQADEFFNFEFTPENSKLEWKIKGDSLQFKREKEFNNITIIESLTVFREDVESILNILNIIFRQE